MTNYRAHLINYLIRKKNYTRYLEIGTQNIHQNFVFINAPVKECVDPAPVQGVTYQMTSDDAFDRIRQLGKQFDIIFIDGLHLDYQVDRDIVNALSVLSEDGTIVLHDCKPEKEIHQTEELQRYQWTGTVWKSVAKVRATRPDLECFVVDVDWGCGIIRRAKEPQRLIDLEPELNWDYFCREKQTILGLIPEEEFFIKFKDG